MPSARMNISCHAVARDACSQTWLWMRCLLLLALVITVSWSSAYADGLSLKNNLSATPLVLKDGRIARVSIHTIPFPEEAAALASGTASELKTFTRSMATDCFLTAQVIGHVDKVETSGRDTADIHRLARARADTIQQSLISNGLPAASIASVWDWQFMVQDARATLWIFQLAAGEDCGEEALHTVAQDEIAENNNPIGEPDIQQQVSSSAKTQPEPVRQHVVAAAKAAPSAVTRPIPAAAARQTTDPSGDTQIKQAAAPAVEAKAPVKVTSVSPSLDRSDENGRVVISESGALEITFATNSSYLPQGARAPLQAFLGQLSEGTSYTLQVQTTIDGDPSVSGSSSEAEAVRYNKWLADRRFERVKAWLLKNSKGTTLQIEPAEIINDGTRRVIVELNPLG